MYGYVRALVCVCVVFVLYVSTCAVVYVCVFVCGYAGARNVYTCACAFDVCDVYVDVQLHVYAYLRMHICCLESDSKP